MRTILWVLGLFSLAVALVLTARYNQSYALLVWQPYRIQIATNLLVLLLGALFVLLYLAVRLVVRTLELPHAVAQFRAERRREVAAQALADATRLYYEGRYGQALRLAEKAYPDVAVPGLAALLAARAAHAMRDPERRQRWLDLASLQDEHVRVARLMVEAEVAAADRRFDDAAQILEALRASGQRHIAALRLALQVEQGRGRWDEVARVARQLRKHNALSHDQAVPLLRRAYIEQLRDAEGDLAALKRLWAAVPANERMDPGFLVRAIPYLIGAGDEVLAHNAIEDVLERDWEPELAALYGRCKSEDLRRQLLAAEGWLDAHPDDAGLLLTLGRLCMRGQLWGKAQSYFEASLSLSPTRAAHLELARLAEQLERDDMARRHFREAASLGA